MFFRKNIQNRLLSDSINYKLLLALLIFLVFLNNFIWLKNNKLPPIGNGLQDLFPGINFYLDAIHNKIIFRNLLNDAIEPLKSLFRLQIFPPSLNNNYIRFSFFIYPPLVPLSYSFFYFLFGPNTGLELMVNMLYLAAAMVSIYGIGKKIFNEKAGFLATFVFSSFPGIISSSRAVHSEFNLMCMITLTLFFLLKTDFFSSRKYSIILGISLGLTALTKWEFPVTIVGPFLWCLSQSHLFFINKKKAPISGSYIRINFFLSILIGILISFSWYSLSTQDIIWRLFSSPNNIVTVERLALPLKSLLIQKFSFYPLSIINTFISFFYFLLLILAGIIFIYRIIKNRNQLSEIKTKLFYALFLVLWIAITYFFLSLLKLHVYIHIIPVLPAIAILISLGIFSLKNIIVRSIFISLIILYGLGSYLHSFVDLGKFGLLYKLKIYLSSNSKFSLTTTTHNIPRDAWERYLFYAPHSRDWKINEILSFIKKDGLNTKPHPVIFIVGHNDKFSCFSFQYYNLLKNYELFIEPRGNDRSPAPPDQSKFDYVVVNPQVDDVMDEKVLSETIKPTLNIEEKHKIVEFKNTFFNKYKLIKEYILPDNTKAKVYKLTSS